MDKEFEVAILVVDDSRAMRMIVRRELRKVGYDEVLEAENGAAALETINGGGVELVLSDFNMPVMNGIELLASLRAGGNDIAFGFVTSDSDVDIRVKALETGASFIITKPFDCDDLGAQIGRTLRADGSPAVGLGGASESTLQGLLADLFGREVVAHDSIPPDRSSPRVYAEYTLDGRPSAAFCVAEMPLAASLACALSRIPPAEAAEWSRSHALNATMEANFFEVANVVTKLVPAAAGHCVLSKVDVLTEGERCPGFEDGAWRYSARVEVYGYPPGRIGFAVP